MNAKYISLIVALMTLNGCQLTKTAIVPDDPRFRPVEPHELAPPPVNNGSLFREGFGLSLYEDNTARRVGDLLTVKLVEQLNSVSDATAKSERSSDISAPNPTILGASPSGYSVPGILGLNGRGESLEAAYTHDNSYEGKGSSTESHSLNNGSISVTVSEVLPNGNMRVRGEKWITLNEDEKYIRLTGIIRPEDVDSENSIESTLIADARISYGGKGMVSESSAPGWVTRFFLSPLWPF